MKITHETTYRLYNDLDQLEYDVKIEEEYQELEAYIDKLIDFAAEIREHEPTWRSVK